jgi:NitT/TauT family transport system substrate-binding protein
LSRPSGGWCARTSRRLSRRELLVGGGLGLSAVLLSSACSGLAAPPTSRPAEPELVRFVSWSQPRAEQANLFAAQELGYFRDQAIQFQFIPGQGSGDALKQVLAGNGEVAFSGPEALFFAADQGSDVVGIYNTYPQNIFVLISWPDARIESPADLRGRTIGILSQASGSRYNVLGILAAAGLKESDVTLVATGPNPAAFIERKVDAWSTISTSAAEVQRQSGQTFRSLAAHDYLNLPTDIFATTREVLTGRSDLLVRFLRAVRRGTQYMIDHPAEAAEISVRSALDVKDPRVAEGIIRAFGEASQSETTRKQGLGSFDLAPLRDGARVYADAGLLKSRIEVDRYFTNDLIGKL